MRSRIVLILIGITLLWGALIGRAAYLQLIPDRRLNALEKRQFETAITLHARRGDVVDRNGHELAASVTSYSIFADPKIIDEPKKLVRILSRELHVSSRSIEEKLHGHHKRFVWIERHLDKSVYDAIDSQLKAEKIRGVGVVQESKRIYPNDKLLSHVLGFVGQDEAGLEGLELSYNDHLQGEKKILKMRKDARGRPLVVAGQMFSQAPEGSDVQLTIDRELQFTLEQELATAVEKHQADSAVGVVLDAQTSEILAMAGAPNFDPNRASDVSPDKKRNRVVTDPFEPGSTMKTFVIAGGLNQGLIEPNTKIDCEGGIFHIGKRVIREADSKHKFQMLTVSEILAYSSNVGATKIAFKLGDEKVNEAFRQFGFGQKTGIDLPGESRGIIQPLPWHDHLLANISFGHGIAATPLQIANAYAVIANGGWLKQPYIVKSVHDRETDEVIDGHAKVLRRVLSDQAVAKMRMMLTGVTSGDGTGLNARVPGFPVAGKTGTAQMAELHGRGYVHGGYVSSFAGFIPANDPKFVIYIAVDHPRKEYYGAAVAAPVFANVASFAVRRMGLAPVMLTKESLMPMTGANEMLEARRESAKLGSKPVATTVSAGSHMDYAQQPMTENSVRIQHAVASGLVPDLDGMALREVLSRLSGTGIRVQVQGDGFVTKTLPAAGTQLSEAKALTVYLSK